MNTQQQEGVLVFLHISVEMDDQSPSRLVPPLHSEDEDGEVRGGVTAVVVPILTLS